MDKKRQLITQIDLSNSFTLADHHRIANEVIIIDSDDEVEVLATAGRNGKQKTQDKPPENSPQTKVGDCPICWDNLEKNSLVSTKCGHVFCLTCLEDSLQLEKKCPICRSNLKAKNSYHPLFLPTKK